MRVLRKWPWIIVCPWLIHIPIIMQYFCSFNRFLFENILFLETHVDITVYWTILEKNWFQRTANKFTFLNQTIPPIGTAVGSFWIGGSDMLVEGEWEWMTSHKLITFTDWASGEPADFLNQDCLDIKGSVHYHWNDSPCSYLHWFICEKHVYVLQLLTLIIVRVLYLKLKKKKI